MSAEFRLPDLGEGLDEAEIVRWLVADGDQVQRDQGVLEVETDKAVVEVPAPATGRVRNLTGSPGDTVHVGDLLFVVETVGGTPAASPESAPARAVGDGSGPAPAPTPPAAPVTAAVAAAEAGARVRATPAVRKLARDLGVNIDAVRGSGPDGRILAADIEAIAKGGAAPVAVEAPAAPEPVARPPAPAIAAISRVYEGPDEERVPLHGIRKRIAETMTESKRTIPHITGMDELDASALMALRERLKGPAETAGLKLTYLPIIVKAAVAVLKRYPMMNASLDMEKREITVKHRYNVGIAIATADGLIVPVVRDVDRKTIVEIGLEIAALSEQARSRSLSLEALQAGTFTVTNFGSLGGWHGTPIIKPGESAILGVGRIQPKAVVVDGQIVARPMMALDVTADHRLVDGDVLTAFSRELIAVLEEPASLLLEMV